MRWHLHLYLNLNLHLHVDPHVHLHAHALAPQLHLQLITRKVNRAQEGAAQLILPRVADQLTAASPQLTSTTIHSAARFWVE